MNESLTVEDYIERQQIETANTISAAYRAFGGTESRFEEHHIFTEMKEAIPTIPVDHSIDIKLTVPVVIDKTGQLAQKGDRKISFTILGERRERGSGPERGDKHSTQIWYDSDMDTEIPVLAQSVMAYNLHRTRWVVSTLTSDGTVAGIQEIKDTDPSLFLDTAANVVNSRSMSIRRLGAIVTIEALDAGLSHIKEYGRLNFSTFAAFMGENGFSREQVRAAQDGRKLETLLYKGVTPLYESESDARLSFAEIALTSLRDRVRTDSIMYESDYTGFSPIDPDKHALYTQVLDPESDEIGVRSRAFDAVINISQYPDVNEKMLASDERTFGMAVRQIRKASEAYLQVASTLFRDRAA